MNSYFNKIKYFKEQDKPAEIKCDCAKRLKAYRKGKFSIVGKSFYIHKVPALFGNANGAYWQHILDAIEELVKIGYIPAQFPVNMIKCNTFSCTIYVEILNPKHKPKYVKDKIKTFDENFRFQFVQDTRKTPGEIKRNWMLEMLSLSTEDKFEFVQRFFSKDRYNILMHCPLCPEGAPLLSLFVV